MTTGIKILSDFDGVWTDPFEEAGAVRALLIARAAQLAGVELPGAEADFERFAGRVLDRPERHGWAPDGRITAYVDEDPFCLPNAVASWLGSSEGRADATAERYRRAIEETGLALNEFGDRCFHDATLAYRERGSGGLLPGSRAVVAALREAGAELVVVSNSSSDKVIAWFEAAGVDAREQAGGELRVRGSAAKFALGPGEDALQVGQRQVLVDRPRYREVLAEEAPQIVIGDVFSLDLALPEQMRRERHPSAAQTLVLRRQSHTPAWILEDRAGGAIDHLVDEPGELLSLLEGPPSGPS